MNGTRVLALALGCATTAVVSLHASLDAQEPAVGDRLRVRVLPEPQRWSTGTLIEAPDGYLVLRTGRQDRLRIVRDSVTVVERSAGRQSKWGLGAGIGAGVGTAATLVALLTTCRDTGIPTHCDGQAIWLAFTIPAAGLGVLLGHVFGRERWVPLDESRARFGWIRNWGLGVELVFR